MFYACDCGEVVEDKEDNLQGHVLDEHLDLVEMRFDELLDRTPEEMDYEEYSDDELYNMAVDDVVGEILDEILEA